MPANPPSDPPRTSASGYDLTPPSARRARAAGRVAHARGAAGAPPPGTEPAFCGGLLANKEPGVYHCRLCDLPLFRSAAKFESGTGWPSFYEPFDPEHVAVRRDTSHGMVRDEIVCGRCGGHLGHVFQDGPRPPACGTA